MKTLILLILISVTSLNSFANQAPVNREVLNKIFSDLVRECEVGSSHIPSETKKLIKENLPQDAVAKIYDYFKNHSKAMHQLAMKDDLSASVDFLSPKENKPLTSCESNQEADHIAWSFYHDYKFPDENKMTNDPSQLSLEKRIEEDTPLLRFGNKLVLQGTSHIAEFQDKALIDGISQKLLTSLKREKPDFIYLEGVPAKLGTNSCQIIVSSFYRPGMPYSEVDLAIEFAIQNHISFSGSEPSKEEIAKLASDDFLKKKMAFPYPEYLSKDSYSHYLSFIELTENLGYFYNNIPKGKDFSFQNLPEEKRKPMVDVLRNGFAKSGGKALKGSDEDVMKMTADYFYTYIAPEKRDELNLVSNFMKEDLRPLYQFLRTAPEIDQKENVKTVFAFEVEARDAFMRKQLIKQTERGKKTYFLIGNAHLHTNKAALTDYYSE